MDDDLRHSHCGPVDWDAAARASMTAQRRFDAGDASPREARHWRAWLRHEVIPRIVARGRDPGNRTAAYLFSMCCLSRYGALDGYLPEPGAGPPPPRHVFERPDRLQDRDGRLAPLRPGRQAVLRFGFLGYVPGSPSLDGDAIKVFFTDRRGSPRVHRVRPRHDTYMARWAVTRPPHSTAERLPFREEPYNDPEAVWAVRLDAGGWVLARPDPREPGVLRQAWGATRYPAPDDHLYRAPVVPLHGAYGVDHGELQVPVEDECDGRATHHLRVRHPALEDCWMPAVRRRNRFWIQTGEGLDADSMIPVSDPSVGRPDGLGISWKHPGAQ